MNEVYIKVEDLGYLDKYFKGQDIITLDRLVAKLEDLDAELEALQEEFDDYKEHEDYAKFNPYKEYGLNERDFH